VTKWKLRCMECGTVWVLKVSFDLREMGRIYHYCRTCKRNTFHEVLGLVEEESGGPEPVDESGGPGGVEEAPDLVEEPREG